MVSLLYCLGHTWSPNVYRRLAEIDWFPSLRNTLVERALAAAIYKVDRMHHATAQLLYEICRVQELSIDEMGKRRPTKSLVSQELTSIPYRLKRRYRALE